MILSLINFFTKECLIPMCRDFSLYSLLYALDKVSQLSQCINTFEILSLANKTTKGPSIIHLLDQWKQEPQTLIPLLKE